MHVLHATVKPGDLQWLDAMLSLLEEKIVQKNVMAAFDILRAINDEKCSLLVKGGRENRACLLDARRERHAALKRELDAVAKGYVIDLVQSCEKCINELDLVKASRLLGLLEAISEEAWLIDVDARKVVTYIDNARAWMAWAREHQSRVLNMQLALVGSLVGEEIHSLRGCIHDLEERAKRLGIVREREDDVRVLPPQGT